MGHSRSRQNDPDAKVRLATMDDVDDVVTTVTAAFAPDLAWAFMMGPGNDLARQAFAYALLAPRISRGTAWVTHDCSAVAMWDRKPPDDVADPQRDAGWARFRDEVGADVWERLETYEQALDLSGPTRPFWYLGVLATHPDVHGQGLATAVLQPGLSAAAADGWDCWLETSTAANKSFYGRRGFTDSRVVDIPGGPPTWWLRRPHG